MEAPRSAIMPAQAAELKRWTLQGGDELRSLRSDLDLEVLGAELAGDQVRERMILVATELASNALRHGAPPVMVQLLRATGCLIVSVSDAEVERIPRSAGSGGMVAGGRGLLIAHSLSDDLCWYVDGPTKHVWASFTLMAAGAN